MVDPDQSVKGKVVIDALCAIPGVGMMMMPQPSAEPLQTTSNVGHLTKFTIQACIHGLDRYYYSLVIDWRKNDLEEQMLMNLHKKDWSQGLQTQPRGEHQAQIEKLLDAMKRSSSKGYVERVKQEEGLTAEEVAARNVGHVDL